MKRLPPSATPFKKTAVFDEQTVPSALLHSHRTKEGIWGKIVVVEGALLYRSLEPAIEEVELTPETFGVVEPEARHEVVPRSGVRFYVEFFHAD